MPRTLTLRPLRTLVAALGTAAALVACASLGTEADQARADDLWSRVEQRASWGHFEGFEGLQPGRTVHGDFVRVFLNDVGRADPDGLPAGTVIVKEGYGSEDPDSLKALTVMQRVPGYDPDNGDWFWARYTPDGELTHSGQVAFCADCHFDAGNDDFVFLND